MKKFIFFLVYIILIAFIFFVIGEIIFRIFRGAPTSLHNVTQQQRETLFQPNTTETHYSSIEGEFEYTTHINSFGYRGEDFSFDKPNGVVRVLALGDSFTYGVGVNDNQTIPAVLQTELLKQGRRVEMINAGVGNTGPVEHYMNLRDIHLKYKPDVVLLFLDMTDIMDDWRAERHGIFDKDGNILRIDPTFVNGKRDWWRVAASKSAFCKWIHNKIVRSFFKLKRLGFKNYIQVKKEGKKAKAVIINADKTESKEEYLQYDGMLMLRGQQRQELIHEQWARSSKYIINIRDMLEKNGIPMVFVMYPHGIYVGKKEWHEGRKTWGFEQNKIYTDHLPFEIVKEFVDRQNIPFVNTLNAFLRASDGPYFFSWDGHMTAAGYALVAEVIAKNASFREMLSNLK